jgi:hypothetical protein
VILTAPGASIHLIHTALCGSVDKDTHFLQEKARQGRLFHFGSQCILLSCLEALRASPIHHISVSDPECHDIMKATVLTLFAAAYRQQ